VQQVVAETIITVTMFCLQLLSFLTCELLSSQWRNSDFATNLKWWEHMAASLGAVLTETGRRRIQLSRWI